MEGNERLPKRHQTSDVNDHRLRVVNSNAAQIIVKTSGKWNCNTLNCEQPNTPQQLPSLALICRLQDAHKFRSVFHLNGMSVGITVELATMVKRENTAVFEE
ncbi:Protein of unknown function [Gryllus bimaculatus]|nr:Protein of unknown function [Gryllus bimaculatus]